MCSDYAPDVKKPGEVLEDASVYDPGIEAIVPRYDELHDAILNAPPQDRDEPIRGLELGAGTGELTAKPLTRFPESTVVAIDHSEGMLAEADRKLGTFGDRASVERGAFPDDYDDPSTLTDQLVWLRETGLTGVTSIWQYYNFAVYGGRKPE